MSAGVWSELLRNAINVDGTTRVCSRQSGSDWSRVGTLNGCCLVIHLLTCSARVGHKTACKMRGTRHVKGLAGLEFQWSLDCVSRQNSCLSAAPSATPLQYLYITCRLVQKGKSIPDQSHISELRPSLPAIFLAQMPRISSACQHCYWLQIGEMAGCYGWLCATIAQAANRETSSPSLLLIPALQPSVDLCYLQIPAFCRPRIGPLFG